jgi:hypothetical protein
MKIYREVEEVEKVKEGEREEKTYSTYLTSRLSIILETAPGAISALNSADTVMSMAAAYAVNINQFCRRDIKTAKEC